MASQITKTKMLELYEKYLLKEVINTGTRIYAIKITSEDEPEQVVYCTI